MQHALARLEHRYGARLGVAAIDTGDGASIEHRAGERFAFASTDKAFIAAAVLRDSSASDLAAVVHYSKADLLDHAPITSQHVDDGMTVEAIVDAALRFSDNSAANLLVERPGGPEAVQRFLRSIGDGTTSVDRIEPDLNTAVPGTDGTPPHRVRSPGICGRCCWAARCPPNVARCSIGRCAATPRAGCTSVPVCRCAGVPVCRCAGVPAGWTVADKTGAGAYGTRNDIAVVRRPDAAPVVLVLLSDRPAADADSADGLLADATRVVMRALDE